MGYSPNMKVALIFLCALSLAEGSYHPAKDMHASMRQEMPTDPVKYVQDILASESERKTDTDAAKILVVGDSWANVVGTFGPLPSFLERRLTNHSCKAATTSIAIPGTES